jgi:hypothetical protein
MQLAEKQKVQRKFIIKDIAMKSRLLTNIKKNN